MKKRILMSMCCLGLAAAMTPLTLAGEPAKDMTKPVKDAAKDMTKQAKDAAKDMTKQAKDAAKDMTGGQQMSPEMMQAMQRMEAYGALNENHAYLKQYEGEWDCVATMWMAEGAPPTTNKCTSSAKLSFGGHFLIEKFNGEFSMGEGMPAQPFQGMATLGYDNHRKQFVSTWIDNWISGVMIEYGSASQGGKVFTMEGENYCCMNDKVCQTRSITTFVDANTRKMEMWGPGLDGKVYKAFEMTLTRKK